MNKEELKKRTKAFGLHSMKLVRKLPTDVPGNVIAHQLMRSSVSVRANYRSACRARSKAEFVSKLGIVLEETDESAHWLDLIISDEMLPSRQVRPLFLEADELCANFFSAINTMRAGLKNAKC